MSDPVEPGPEDAINLTIEGSEDYSVRRWNGPAPREAAPIGPDDSAWPHEQANLLIVNEEDLSVRPRRPLPSGLERSSSASGLPRSRAKRPVVGRDTRLLVQTETIGGVTVASFSDTKIVTEENIQEFESQLFALVTDADQPQVLLNFGNVQYLSSAALGALIRLKKKVGASKGRIKLCCIHPDLLEVFRTTRLDQVFEIYPDEGSALRKFG